MGPPSHCGQHPPSAPLCSPQRETGSTVPHWEILSQDGGERRYDPRVLCARPGVSVSDRTLLE